ncbi:hypothetical protein DJ028_05910 [Pseudomonas veronii]|nr:hypothetical protein DJ028_05910 [Pseudomonas veronii]
MSRGERVVVFYEQSIPALRGVTQRKGHKPFLFFCIGDSTSSTCAKCLQCNSGRAKCGLIHAINSG